MLRSYRLKSEGAQQAKWTLLTCRSYFLFTPMLPSATVGTLELRSLVEPIRRIISSLKGHYLKAEAVDIEFSEKLVEVAQINSLGEKEHFYLPYDKLVIGVGEPASIPSFAEFAHTNSNAGSKTNPHGVKGLEHCHFLKTIEDAAKIRYSVLQNLERACLPTTTDEERRRLLSFVVCGGGPTGVEFAAELFDMLNEDLTKYFPRILRNEVSVHLLQSRGHILNTYDEALSIYAEVCSFESVFPAVMTETNLGMQERFARDDVDVQTNARVKEIQKDRVLYSQKGEHGEIVTKELPMGFCLWSTGVGR